MCLTRLQGGDQQRQAEHACPDDPPKGADEGPRQANEQGGHLPFERTGHHRPVGGSRLVETLEHPGAERAAIDDRRSELKALERRAVHHSAPLSVAAAIELVRVLRLEHGLGLAIASLLLQVRTRVLTAMVPDERPGANVINRPSCWSRQQMSTSSPALRNWGSNPLIASRASRRNAMLQPGMCSATWSLIKHVRRLAGRGGHAGGQPAILGGQIRPSHRGRAAPRQLMDQMDQPVWIGDAVGIRVSNDGTRRMPEPGICATLKPP